MAEIRQFVSFFIENQLYGLDIRVVKEINPTVAITPVPRTPPAIKGLVNIRGQVVLVMDIAVVFGRGPLTAGDESQVVILKTEAELHNVRGLGEDLDLTPFGDKPVGLLVDRIGDVIGVPAESVEPAPPHIDEGNARHFDGVVRLDEVLLVILDASELLSRVGDQENR